EAIDEVAATPPERLSDEALSALVRCVGAPAKAVQLRAADALAAIARAGDERPAEILRAALSDTNRRIRWGAAFALSRIGGEAFGIDAIDAIAEALGDRDSDVRWAAAELIGRLCLGHPDEIRARLLKLCADADPNARRMALYCIRDVGCCGDDVTAAIERTLSDENRFVRLAAVAALSRIADAEGKAATILGASSDSDPDAGVRRAAQSALEKLGSRQP
ncbi:MAG TPA: HEAT repeat domain-containing protein, partial [Candidatus Binataceae bacterium]|nr:HEAT repeat domain-containing protein [Candidatus Binataceae bacterium]